MRVGVLNHLIAGINVYYQCPPYSVFYRCTKSILRYTPFISNMCYYCRSFGEHIFKVMSIRCYYKLLVSEHFYA